MLHVKAHQFLSHCIYPCLKPLLLIFWGHFWATLHDIWAGECKVVLKASSEPSQSFTLPVIVLTHFCWFCRTFTLILLPVGTTVSSILAVLSTVSSLILMSLKLSSPLVVNGLCLWLWWWSPTVYTHMAEVWLRMIRCPLFILLNHTHIHMHKVWQMAFLERKTVILYHLVLCSINSIV